MSSRSNFPLCASARTTCPSFLVIWLAAMGFMECEILNA